MRVGKALHDNKVAAFDEAACGQGGEKGAPTLIGRTNRGAAAEQSHAIDFIRLLRARRQRPKSGRTADKRYELAPSHCPSEGWTGMVAGQTRRVEVASAAAIGNYAVAKITEAIRAVTGR